MKQKKRWFLTIVFIAASLLSSGQKIFADWNAQIAQDFVDDFNKMNVDQGRNLGFKFTSYVTNGIDHEYPTGTVILTQYPNSNIIPGVLSVYENSIVTNSQYVTFCVQPSTANILSEYSTGTLNYDKIEINDPFKKTYSIDRNGIHRILTIGAAYLYKAYITGELANAGITDPYVIRESIQILMNYGAITNLDNSIHNWLSHYSDLRYIHLWQQDYDPAESYSFMDGYHVFVLNVSDASDKSSQDFLYITREPPTVHSPEPATILFWTLGTIGAVGYVGRHRRSRLNKKTV